MMRRLLLLAVVVAATAVPVHSYSHFGTGVGTTRLHWATMPIRWFATNRGVPGVPSAEFRTAVERAFKTWEDVPTASIQFVFGGTTALEPDEDDGLSVLGFQNHPEMDRVLAATSFDFDDDTGELLEADIFFNSFFEWSTAAGGDAARFDLESVAVHEIGHLLGLGHSAIGETELRPEGGRRVLGSAAVMFPISIGRGAIADRVLQPDDVAGISDLYPEGNFEDTSGGVHGRVRRGSAGVVGAHVVVFNLRTRALVGGFSLGNQGEFQILGLAPGPYVMRVEPLDDADIDSFFDLDSLDIDFQVTYFPRLVVAPSGGVGDSVTVTCTPEVMTRRPRNRRSSRRMRVFFFVLFDLFVCFVLIAAAQTKPAPAPAPRGPSVPRIDLSVGTGFISGSGLGDANADLRGRGGAPLQLFATSSRLGGSPPLEVRLGYRISPRYTLEMRGALSRPEIQTSIAGDVEGASALTVAEKVDLYSLDLGILVMFNRPQPRAITPFISAGAGYAGAVHEGLTLLENGFTYRGGGGITYPLALRNRAWIKAIGVRADGALIFMSGGLASGFGTTHQMAGSGSLYLTF